MWLRFNRLPKTPIPCASLRFEIAARLAGAGNVSCLEKFFQRLSAEPRDHLGVGYAFDAPELLEAEKARSVAHKRGPVELAHHAAFFGGETGPVECRFGVVLEERAVAGHGEAVEETVEAKRLCARGKVEEVGAFEFLGALQFWGHTKGRSIATFRFTKPGPRGIRL